MAKINISIELNEEEVKNILTEDDAKCGCSECSDNAPQEKTYTKQEMLDANLDELSWDTTFTNKYFNVLKHHPAMLNELTERILLGQRIVNSIKGQ